jgi:hypothetical protein
MRVVVNEACDDDDGVCGRVDALNVCVPTVLGEDWDPQGEHSRPQCRDPKRKKRGMVVVRVQGGMGINLITTASGLPNHLGYIWLFRRV